MYFVPRYVEYLETLRYLPTLRVIDKGKDGQFAPTSLLTVLASTWQHAKQSSARTAKAS